MLLRRIPLNFVQTSEEFFNSLLGVIEEPLTRLFRFALRCYRRLRPAKCSYLPENRSKLAAWLPIRRKSGLSVRPRQYIQTGAIKMKMRAIENGLKKGDSLFTSALLGNTISDARHVDAVRCPYQGTNDKAHQSEELRG
jgi:hypothetical protein